MKTKETFAYYGLSQKEFKVPAGLKVKMATNLPHNSNIRFWLAELTPEMEANDELESWFRNYGFGLHLNEVEYDKESLAVMFLEAIAMHPGNLPDERYTRKGGPNDSVDRGLKVVAMRSMAQQALSYLK